MWKYLSWQYTGIWFEVRRYQQDNEDPADCMTSSYTWSFIRRAFDIRRTGVTITPEDQDNELFIREAEALLAFPEEDVRRGILNVTYYADREANQANYFVLGTDYYQYVVGWGCEDEDDNQSREFAWVHSRTPDMPEEYEERIDEYVASFLDPEFFRPTDQSDTCMDLDPEVRAIRMKHYAEKEAKAAKLAKLTEKKSHGLVY